MDIFVAESLVDNRDQVLTYFTDLLHEVINRNKAPILENADSYYVYRRNCTFTEMI
jgi:hypothetical protein